MNGWTVLERLIFGPLVILGYLAVIVTGASGAEERAPEAAQIIHDAMLALGPLVGVVIYAVFGRTFPPGAQDPGDPTAPPVNPAKEA